MVRARQSSGVSTATELRQAESTALRTRLDWVDALVDAQLAHASYRRALGSSAWSEAAADGS
jgi:outer membrane protein TolC